MPVVLLVRAQTSDTFPAPGSWQEGDIVVSRPDGSIWGNKETLPLFIRVRITNVNSPDIGWLQTSEVDGEIVNRRNVRVDPAAIAVVRTEWADPNSPSGFRTPAPTEVHASFNRAQFNSRIVTRL